MTSQHHSPFLAACLQMCSSRDVSVNRDAMVKGIRAAAVEGVQYLQTPEMTNLLERDRTALFEKITSQEHDVVLQAACEEARRSCLYVHIGSLAVCVGDKIANRAFVINPDGQIIAHYDKMHLFDVDLANGESWRESATYTAGNQVVLADLPWGKLGLSICYDVRFPNLYHALAKQGASFLSAPAAFTRQTGEAHWEVLGRLKLAPL
jgi:deaminated glutathione amidase